MLIPSYYNFSSLAYLFRRMIDLSYSYELPQIHIVKIIPWNAYGYDLMYVKNFNLNFYRLYNNVVFKKKHYERRKRLIG